MNIKPVEMREVIVRALASLLKEDHRLFRLKCKKAPTERKLHEICINHALAGHIANEIRALTKEAKYFVDLEFNRHGVKPKAVRARKKKLIVRPDIIVHKRTAGGTGNLLVIECKKEGPYASTRAINHDRTKVISMMEDNHYRYHFGLQVVYSQSGAEGSFYYRIGQSINTGERIVVRSPTTTLRP